MSSRIGRQHDVEFRWARGHSGYPDNERCDQLAMAAVQGRDLAADEGYERVQQGIGSPVGPSTLL